MPPTPTSNDVFNGTFPNTKPLGERRKATTPDSLAVQPANQPDLPVAQLGPTTVLSFGLSSLEIPVCHVIGMRTNEQVVRTDARMVVTSMKNLEICFTKVEKPRVSVSQHARRLAVNFTCDEDSVPVRFVFVSSNPHPTRSMDGVDRTTLINQFPKTIRGRLTNVLVAWHDTAPSAVPSKWCGRPVGFRLFGDQPSRITILGKSPGDSSNTNQGGQE